MQDVCDQLLSPLSERSICQEDWVQAVEAIEATELAQVTRCGKASLNQVLERLQQWHVNAENSDTVQRPKEKVLAECCNVFIEQCAEIIEMAGVPPKLASNLLGVSIRMAEVVGKTGVLLLAMDSDFAQLAEKVNRLELVYDVAVKRVECVAGEVSQLKSTAAAASTQAEMALKQKTEMESQCRELKRALQSSPNQCFGKCWNGRGQKERDDLFQANNVVFRASKKASSNSSVQSAGSRRIVSLRSKNVESPERSAKGIRCIEDSDPLEGAVKAALDHLMALLQHARDLHELPPSLTATLGTLGMANISSAATDLTVSAIKTWADCHLKLQDHVLAASLKQSASHLQCLVHLLNGHFLEHSTKGVML